LAAATTTTLSSAVLMIVCKRLDCHKHPLIKLSTKAVSIHVRQWRVRFRQYQHHCLALLYTFLQQYVAFSTGGTTLLPPPPIPPIPFDKNNDDGVGGASRRGSTTIVRTERERIEQMEGWIKSVSLLVTKQTQQNQDWQTNLERAQQRTEQQLLLDIASIQQTLRDTQQLYNDRIDTHTQLHQAWIDSVTRQVQQAQSHIVEWKHKYIQQQHTPTTTSASATMLGPPPVELTCPITWEVMHDPVLLVDDGHTYERSAIEQILRETTNPRSPKTNRPLSANPQLIPNIAIRSMCRDYEEQQKELRNNNNNSDTTTSSHQ